MWGRSAGTARRGGGPFRLRFAGVSGTAAACPARCDGEGARMEREVLSPSGIPQMFSLLQRRGAGDAAGGEGEAEPAPHCAGCGNSQNKRSAVSVLLVAGFGKAWNDCLRAGWRPQAVMSLEHDLEVV